VLMTYDVSEATRVDLNELQQNELLEVAKVLQKAAKRVDSFESSTSCSSNCSCSSCISDKGFGWIRACVDDPYDKGNNYNVLGYDEALKKIDIRNRKDFQDSKSLVIYCRLPSKLRSSIYVFRENGAVSNQQSRAKYRVSTDANIPKGFVTYRTIPLRSLGFKSRFMIWLGRVRWLFIITEPSSRHGTFESEKVQNTQSSA